MDKDRLSIIIPTLNEETNLKSLLPYLNQHKDDYTDIIVADACTTVDDSTHICKTNNVQRVACKASSRAAQMNKGASIVQDGILYFLHADVLPPKTFVNDIRTSLAKGTDFAIFSYRFDSDSKLLAINSRFTRRKGLFAGGGDQSLCLTKSTFESLGGFDEYFTIMEDFRFFHKALKIGLSYEVIPNDVIVSARKYKQNSYLRVNLSNLVAFSLYHLGTKPNTIKKIYSKLLK